MSFEIIVFSVLIVLVIVEVLTIIVVHYVNKKFQWLIIKKDEKPILSKSGLEKFIPHAYDSELGWVRKPNTSHEEVGKCGSTKWTINENGARTNPGFENIESKISCYGDSFTFCRQVNDDETWENYISEILNTNVQNFGVGNYGIDQSILRLKREYPKNRTNIVILAVVPDTICRIISVWKHYYEYGNTFGFKPRFVINNNKLSLLKNFIDNESKFSNYSDYFNQIRKHDFFYKEKFKKELIHFPYSLTLLKNIKRNLGIIYWVLLIRILKKMNKQVSHIDWNPMKIIMQINLKWRVKLYNDYDTVKLLKKIIEEFVLYSKQEKFVPVFSFLPLKEDLNFIKNNYGFYENVLNEIRAIQGLNIIDVTKDFLNKENLDELYSDDNVYGGHLSKEGNKKLAELFKLELERLGIL